MLIDPPPNTGPVDGARPCEMKVVDCEYLVMSHDGCRGGIVARATLTFNRLTTKLRFRVLSMPPSANMGETNGRPDMKF